MKTSIEENEGEKAFIKQMNTTFYNTTENSSLYPSNPRFFNTKIKNDRAHLPSNNSALLYAKIFY